MSDWKQKRFWTDAKSSAADGGYEVLLDGRRLKTPAKASLLLPTRGLADAIAAEWQAQQEIVNPNSMPMTRTANSAIDKVQTQHAAVADMLSDYGDSDLLCYRADTPAELVARQAQAWDPMLDWAARTLGARLLPRTGVIHAPQDPGAIQTLRQMTHALSAFQLAAFHDLVSLSGSLILGFAAARDVAPIEDIWRTSRIDETWQEDQWGRDDDAHALALAKQSDFEHAKRFFDLS